MFNVNPAKIVGYYTYFTQVWCDCPSVTLQMTYREIGSCHMLKKERWKNWLYLWLWISTSMINPNLGLSTEVRNISTNAWYSTSYLPLNWYLITNIPLRNCPINIPTIYAYHNRILKKLYHILLHESVPLWKNAM